MLGLHGKIKGTLLRFWVERRVSSKWCAMDLRYVSSYMAGVSEVLSNQQRCGYKPCHMTQRGVQHTTISVSGFVGAEHATGKTGSQGDRPDMHPQSDNCILPGEEGGSSRCGGRCRRGYSRSVSGRLCVRC